DFGLRWRGGFSTRHAVQKLPVSARDRGDVLRLLLAALDLEAPDARVGDFVQVLERAQILGGNQVAAIELDPRIEIGQHVVLAARLRTRSSIGAALRYHPG